MDILDTAFANNADACNSTSTHLGTAGVHLSGTQAIEQCETPRTKSDYISVINTAIETIFALNLLLPFLKFNCPARYVKVVKELFFYARMMLWVETLLW